MSKKVERDSKGFNFKPVLFYWVNLFLKVLLIIGIFLISYASLVYVIASLGIEIAELILKYIKTLIWPLVVILIICLFKSKLSDLIDRIYEFNFPFVSLKSEVKSAIAQQEGGQVEKTKGKSNYYKKLLESKQRKIEYLSEDKNKLIDRLFRAETELEFERIYNIIFASQIEFLRILLSGEVNWDFLSNYYQQVKYKARTVLNEWNAFQYISYLVSTNLISVKENRKISITQKGRAFLAYLDFRNYQKFGI